MRRSFRLRTAGRASTAGWSGCSRQGHADTVGVLFLRSGGFLPGAVVRVGEFPESSAPALCGCGAADTKNAVCGYAAKFLSAARGRPEVLRTQKTPPAGAPEADLRSAWRKTAFSDCLFRVPEDLSAFRIGCAMPCCPFAGAQSASGPGNLRGNQISAKYLMVRTIWEV